MKIDIYTWEDDEGYKRQALYIDEVDRKYVGPLCECPEDAIIGRDLIDCEDLLIYFKAGYETAKKGETFEVFTMTNVRKIFN